MTFCLCKMMHTVKKHFTKYLHGGFSVSTAEDDSSGWQSPMFPVQLPYYNSDRSQKKGWHYCQGETCCLYSCVCQHSLPLMNIYNQMFSLTGNGDPSIWGREERDIQPVWYGQACVWERRCGCVPAQHALLSRYTGEHWDLAR